MQPGLKTTGVDRGLVVEKKKDTASESGAESEDIKFYMERR